VTTRSEPTQTRRRLLASTEPARTLVSADALAAGSRRAASRTRYWYCPA
jgi:hypothetical protein